MEINKDTFEAQFPLVQEAILKADFISMDCEFTGLPNLGGEASRFDTPHERYQKASKMMGEFALSQIGVAAFQFDAESNSYQSRAFNFYLFPRSGNAKLDRKFSCLNSSLEFLSQNKFDFNKWIFEGVTYMNRDEEENYLRRVAPVQTPESASKPLIELDENAQKFANELFEKVDGWLQNSSGEPLILPASNSFYRRVTFEQIGKKYNNFLTTESFDVDSKTKAIRVSKLTQEQKDEQQKKKARIFEGELREQVGFRRVIDLLIDNKKPIIGHNSFLDLLQIYTKLYKQPPRSLSEFKNEVHSIFPLIVDTKYLSVTDNTLKAILGNTFLEEVMNRVKTEPFASPAIENPEGFVRYSDGENTMYHEAGFDAYCTGVVFARFMHYIAKEGKVEEFEKKPVSELLKHEIFAPYLNQIPVVRAGFVSINLVGEEQEPSRANVFYVHDFPATITTNDIKEQFNKKGLGSVFCRWIDDTSVLVTILDQAKVPLALEAFVEDAAFKVDTYETYATRTPAPQTPQAFAVPQTPQTPQPDSTPVTPVNKRPRLE